MFRIKSSFPCLLVILLLSSCASTRKFNFGSSESGYILTYRGQNNSVLEYEMTTTGVGSSEREGQTYESENSRFYKYSLKSQPPDSLVNFEITAEAMTQTFSNMGQAREIDLSYLLGKRAVLRITPHGKLRQITALDSITVPEDGMFRNTDPARLLNPGFFQLPAKPVKIGDTWSETKNDTMTTADSTRGYSNTTINEKKIEYSIVTEEVINGRQCLHLNVKTQFYRESSGDMMGSEINSEGEGETITDIWFAYQEGVLVKMESTNFYEGTTAFSGQMSMTMPQSNESKTVVTLIK